MGGEWLELIPVVSLLLQIAAAVLALNLIQVTGWRFAWLSIAIAVSLLAIKRSLTVLRVFAGESAYRADPAAELTALAVSALLLAGIASIAPLFRSVKRAGRALRESEERYRRMVDAAGEGVWLLDNQARTIYVNPCMAAMLGYTVAEMLDRPLFHFLDPQSRVEAERNFKRHRLGIQEQYDLSFRRKDGADIWTIFSANVLVDEKGQFIGTLGMVTDITDRKGQERRMLRLAQYDPLTGLPNRGLLVDRLRQALAFARRHQHQVAVFFVDLDRFKPINDALGHAAGDAVLKEVARRLESRVRQVDTVSRYGGDEFVVVLQGLADVQEAARLAQAFVERLGQPFQVGERSCNVGASIGISVYPADGDSGEDLIRFADEAMYHAKQAGGERYRFYSEPQ